jgi:hypothetical protein
MPMGIVRRFVDLLLMSFAGQFCGNHDSVQKLDGRVAYFSKEMTPYERFKYKN